MALQGKMAASAHSRTHNQAAKPGSSSTEESRTSIDEGLREARISVRLSNPASASEASALSLWEREDPAASLALDLIVASDGEPLSREGDVLVAGFTAFQPAILAARRLQWAVQGFSEAGDPPPACLAVLVYSTLDEPDQAAVGALSRSLAQAAAGAILLTEKAAQPLENLPGFPLQAAKVKGQSKGQQGKGLRELLWRAPEAQSTRAFDEQILSQLAGQQTGPAAPEQSLEQSPEQSLEQPVQPVPARPEADVPEELKQHSFALLREQPRWMMGGAALAAVLIVVAVLAFHGKPKPAPAGTAPSSTVASNAPLARTVQPPSTGSANPVGSSPADSRASAATPPQTKADKKAAEAAKKQAAEAATATQSNTVKQPVPPPPPPAVKQGRCDLDSSQFSGQIDLAWKNLGRGRYGDAQREFGAVLACDPGNGRAREGLERARMAAHEADGN